ncbi:hypothetical protein F4604DRAFT_1592179 [Suillus subluteus]|nr:hypothetical protein F4604DRAFT_1592179 [Suillus subluteus]
MLTSKVICDDTYSNKSWSIVAQGMFQLREINQVRRQYPSGHHLFVSTFMLTSKVICDDTYSNKSCSPSFLVADETAAFYSGQVTPAPSPFLSFPLSNIFCPCVLSSCISMGIPGLWEVS